LTITNPFSFESKFEHPMDRNIVYPGAIPLDSDLLSINRNTMIAIGYLMRATLGTNTAIDGLNCSPTLPASMSVQVGPGSIVQMSVVDTTSYGSLGADASDPLMKMGINVVTQFFELQSPTNSGNSVNYLIQASFQESDQGLTVLPYYNAANPAQPYSGPTNSGQPQATSRNQIVQLQLKSGVPSSTGTQLTPTMDLGWIGLYVITAAYGQTAITAANIAILPTAPIIGWKLPLLRPGFGSGVQSFASSDSFIVPTGVYQIEAELWGGGSGSFASVMNSASGGGSGGGYAKKRITNLTPGQAIVVIIGAGGVAGGAGTPAGAGGTSSLGQFVSATGGGLNRYAIPADPPYGATPPGFGVNGDVNLTGSAGQGAILNQGGMGGGAPMGGGQNSGTTGVAGTSPGGGASGAGTGANSATPYIGAAGGGGLIVIRW
jgi:hypothetical protein